MYQSQNYVPKRERAELYNILCSWCARPYVFKENGKIIGYCVMGDGIVSEIFVEKPEKLLHAVRTIVAEKGAINIVLPDFLPEYIEALEPVAEETTLESDKMFSALCFARVIQAFFCLKAGYTALPDGEFTALVHGSGGDEKLLLSVKNNVATVEEISGDPSKEPEIELAHLEAMRFFFAPVCEKRRRTPYYVQGWLPLPLWLYSADNV